MGTVAGDPTGPRFRIEDIYPCVDGGRYPVKRIAGEPVEVWADIFREGHDVIAAALLWRPEADRRMAARTHDAAQQRPLARLVHAARSRAGTYSRSKPGPTSSPPGARNSSLKHDAGQDVTLEAREGAQLLSELMPRERARKTVVVEAALSKFAANGDPAALLTTRLRRPPCADRARAPI